MRSLAVVAQSKQIASSASKVKKNKAASLPLLACFQAQIRKEESDMPDSEKDNGIRTAAAPLA